MAEANPEQVPETKQEDTPVVEEQKNKEAEGPKVVRVAGATPPVRYVDNVTRQLKVNEEVQLSGLGIAVTTVVTAAEMLKNQGVAEIKSIETSMARVHERAGQKPKIVITLVKSSRFDEVYEVKQAMAEENKEIKDLLKAGRDAMQKKIATPE
mmetsp:Transcript_5845/g.6353  ORF Transcript_5845/g.6353 Transcript_5845/m.6353 type:complete len:153 (+) Transcript_5845:92-550(+)|eukprot:CAMPEP_0168518722 /NCGR_PEP_ID=MMETSP0405-20121227/6885_1 /TAXON_ID=498012 /ORGANISM="Trichosphaerium sp, Strain Am-I-7 wt" /LENGTH=152 /DNA_ID=CAMNT_0008539115 /DNA_START=77 /DNA_END=535 /DNA_ORIENTATION=+